MDAPPGEPPASIRPATADGCQMLAETDDAALGADPDLDMPQAGPAGLPWAARPAGPPGRREDARAQPRPLLHIACQAGGPVLAGLPTRYLCGAPVRILLCAIAPGDGPDGPGVCAICAALDHREKPALSIGSCPFDAGPP